MLPILQRRRAPCLNNLASIVEQKERIRHTDAMKRLCPTIQELLAFDTVVRHQSMTAAANVLCISVSGISKQLSGLEAFVGRPLLTKKGRGVELTRSGREYWLKISPSLRTIESATVEAMTKESETGVLTLASAPTFLTKWLIPRLTDFRRQHSGVTFSFNQHLSFGEAHVATIDAAIRYGDGLWPNVVSDYITGREFVCIYSSDWAKRGECIRTAEQITQFTLLHHEEAPLAWQKWARKQGIEEWRILSGPRFVQYSSLIQAALNGLGMGLVPKILVEEELLNGRALCFGEAIEIDQGHYLCFNESRLERPAFAAFRTWILEQGAVKASESGANFGCKRL